MATEIIDHSAGACPPAGDREMPFFSASGCPTALFTVADSVDAEQSLDCASAFLASAIELGMEGAGMQDGGRWVLVYLAEMAKALIDTAFSQKHVTDRIGNKAAEGSDHG